MQHIWWDVVSVQVSQASNTFEQISNKLRKVFKSYLTIPKAIWRAKDRSRSERTFLLLSFDSETKGLLVKSLSCSGLFFHIVNSDKWK